MLLLLCATGASSQTVLAQAGELSDGSRFQTWFFGDAGNWIRTTDGKRVLRVATSLAVLVPLSYFDQQESEAARDWGNGGFGEFLRITNRAGGPYALSVPAAIFSISLLGNNEKFQDAAFTSLQAPIYAGLVTLLVKTTFGRSRPEDGRGARDFNPFTDINSAFPSGHATAAFAILAPWTFYYPNVFTYSLLTIGTGTAIARMERQKHWLTDVVAGSAMGLSMAYWLSRKHQGKPTRITLSPSLGSGGVGMRMSLNL